MIDLSSLTLLKGKKALVTGIANDKSIAWGCAKAFEAFGAELAITYLNDKSRTYVEPPPQELPQPRSLMLKTAYPSSAQAWVWASSPIFEPPQPWKLPITG